MRGLNWLPVEISWRTFTGHTSNLKNIWVLLFGILTISSCKQHKLTDSDSADKIYDYSKYNRYILVKSDSLFASGAKISDFGQLFKEGNVYNHVFSFGEISGWELIKVSDELDNVYFYNIAYWLLGFGEQDPNHADKSVIILTDKERNEIKYLGLIDSDITEIDDSMLLVSDKGEQFIIEIPFHTYKPVDKKLNCSINDFLTSNLITADDLKDPILVRTTIRFNEKTAR